jgi:hypothetical protein
VIAGVSARKMASSLPRSAICATRTKCPMSKKAFGSLSGKRQADG